MCVCGCAGGRLGAASHSYHIKGMCIMLGAFDSPPPRRYKAFEEESYHRRLALTIYIRTYPHVLLNDCVHVCMFVYVCVCTQIVMRFSSTFTANFSGII